MPPLLAPLKPPLALPLAAGCGVISALGVGLLVYPFASSRAVVVDAEDRTLILVSKCFGDQSRMIHLSRIRDAYCRELVRRRSRGYPASDSNLQTIYAAEVTTLEGETLRLYETTVREKVERFIAAITEAINANEEPGVATRLCDDSPPEYTIQP
jgi:hypothetical protein